MGEPVAHSTSSAAGKSYNHEHGAKYSEMYPHSREESTSLGRKTCLDGFGSENSTSADVLSVYRQEVVSEVSFSATEFDDAKGDSDSVEKDLEGLV
jgi:hypothetical protein